MKHYGDIKQINGSDVPPVNVIIGGSPCQDLSVAGKRAGLSGERSGLFMEQIRVIKEMRCKDEERGRTGSSIRPRFMVWENVPGAFSSHRGEDFQAVLEETVKIIEPKAPPIPMPCKGWPTAGSLVGDGWSVAWRVFDAQYWGTPQRRRRIALIADFGGQSAPEILFERESVSRHTPPSGTPWKEFAAAVAERFGNADSVKPAVYDAIVNGDGETVPTIAGDHENRVTDYTSVVCGFPLGFRPENVRCYEGKATTICNGTRAGHCNGIVCMATQQGGAEIRTDDKSPTLTAAAGMSGNNQPVIAIDRAAFNQGENALYEPKISEDGINSTLTAKGPSAVCAAVDCRNGTENEEINGTLQAKSNGGTSYNLQNDVRISNAVRRLTPLECERLQGFPDGWTDIDDYIDTNGKKHKTSDSARYKALGNSIALPSWVWVLERLSYCCRADRTMASLFDGIGGFPLIWETLNGKGTCLWASEIEEFPIAVTKYHFT